MSISSDEVNFLVYRYLQESGILSVLIILMISTLLNLNLLALSLLLSLSLSLIFSLCVACEYSGDFNPPVVLPRT